MRFLVFLLALVMPAAAEPLDHRSVQVTDGDTIRVDGRAFRLVGFDAPETFRAKCLAERELGNRATFRMRQLVASGGASLEAIPCACRPGTEGTPACNYGRACGVLTVAGHDVADIMVSEGLARIYVCSGTKCPKRAGWCD